MATLNGVTPSASPLPDTSASSAKRKHDDISTDAIVNGEHTANERNDPKDIQDSIRDIWELFNAQDIPPRILERISSQEASNDASGDKNSSNKRQKLKPSSPSLNIASKIKLGQYQSYAPFLEDIEDAWADVLKSIQPEDPNASGTSQSPVWAETPEQERLRASLAAAKKYLTGLVHREKQRLRLKLPYKSRTTKFEQDDDVKPNSIGLEETSLEVPATTEQPQPQRTVLTLFGNAQGHKQLFSSLQKPMTKLNSAKKSNTAALNTDDKDFIPLREGGLPIGLTSTKVLPIPKDAAGKSIKPRRTLQDLFAPPSSVRPLSAPKTPKVPPSRESTITWSRGGFGEQNPRPAGYVDEKLATGTWLGYGGLAPAEEPSSPQAKRKQRDRVLSIGEASLTLSRSAQAAQLQAQEEALFRSAYSSFAPSRDNSTALVPEEIRNEMWWEKFGLNYYDQAFAIDPALLESQEAENQGESQVKDKETLYQEAVEHFIPTSVPTPETAPSLEAKEAEEMLLEVSQMIETLHSYQRIRMSSLSAGSRTSLAHISPLQDLTGSPSTPSAAETETYNTLRSQLALIISMLPPYAVAKLDGDQLGDLNISREIPVEMEEYRGVMEEDKPSRDAKQAAFQAAVGVAAATNRQTPLQAAAQQARAAQLAQSARGHHPQNQVHYNSAPQSMPRAQPQFSRQPLSSWQKPNTDFRATTQRPAYASPQNFNQQPTRNMGQPMRQQYPQMAQQRPGSFSQLPNGSNQSTPQLSYPQRAQNQGSPTHNIPNGTYGPSPSPSKSIQRNYQQPQMHYQGQSPQIQSPQQHVAQVSPSQSNGQLPQMPHQAQQNGVPASVPSATPSQPLDQPLPSAPSPLPRPTSSSGIGANSGTGDTDGVAVTSRTSTPATPAPLQTQSNVPEVANMTPISQG